MAGRSVKIRSLVDMWKEGEHTVLCFNLFCFNATWEALSLKLNIHIKNVGRFKGVNWVGHEQSMERRLTNSFLAQ